MLPFPPIALSRWKSNLRITRKSLMRFVGTRGRRRSRSSIPLCSEISYHLALGFGSGQIVEDLARDPIYPGKERTRTGSKSSLRTNWIARASDESVSSREAFSQTTFSTRHKTCMFRALGADAIFVCTAKPHCCYKNKHCSVSKMLAVSLHQPTTNSFNPSGGIGDAKLR